MDRDEALRIGVIGCGYLGATHAASLASLGFEVLGLDVVESKVDALNAADLPFFEPGLNELVQAGRDSGKLRFTTSYDELAAFADVFFVCVSTPQRLGELAADVS